MMKGEHPRKILDEALELLENGFFAYLSTAELGCMPHITTMFYLWEDETQSVYLITSERTKKLKNIRVNHNVALTIDERDPNSPARNKGVLLRGRAEVLSIEEMGDLRLNRYLNKYLDFLGYGFPMGSRVVIQVTPRMMHYWKGIHFYKWKNPMY